MKHVIISIAFGASLIGSFVGGYMFRSRVEYDRQPYYNADWYEPKASSSTYDNNTGDSDLLESEPVYQYEDTKSASN